MRAQNLTISVPPADPICDKNCPYCVSRMTGYMKTNRRLFYKNMPKVKTLAKHAQVSSVLLTGKGEPTLSEQDTWAIIQKFNHLPVELQTNGKAISQNFDMLEAFQQVGLNVLAVSIDDTQQFVDYYELFARSKEIGLVTRVTFNVINQGVGFEALVDLCQENHVDQLMLRCVVVPNNISEEDKTAAWIKKNVDEELYPRLYDEMRKVCTSYGMLLRRLNFGSLVYDYRGLSVSYSDYCVQDANDGKDIRSLIYMEDGHCYTSWNSKASILF